MGWEQLISIGREAAGVKAEEEIKKPEACPNDGEPLKEGPGGILFCPFDGWSEN